MTILNERLYNQVSMLVHNELREAAHKFGRFNTEHEGVAIIEEEFMELRECVFKKGHGPAHKVKEAVQLAAMAIRFIMDCHEADL